MKTKIAALITALLVILIGAGGVFYISQTSPQIKGVVDSGGQIDTDELPENQSVRYIEDPIDTRVEDWLKFLGQELGLNTLNIADGNFVWKTEVGEEELFGQAIILSDTLDVTTDTIIELFENSEFEQDAFNLDASVNEKLHGYTKDDLACLIKGISGEEVSTEVSCSLINLEKIVIKKLLLEKGDRDSSTILVDIIQSTADHMSGSVQFIEPDEEKPAQNDVEAFLVAKNDDGGWVLVFEGNEKILCSVIEPYDFPVEMLPECFDEITNEMINRSE